jgi:lysozyme
MYVEGIDVSKWDGNWTALKAREAGAAFVFIKASQATFTDVQFAKNWKKAKEAGLLRGAYHYLDYSKPARSQADYFANLLDPDPGELPPVVDFEQQVSGKNAPSPRSYLRDFLAQMKTHGYSPIIYTAPSFWREFGDNTSSWSDFPLWIAHYTSAAAPSVPSPWTRWTFWQYSEKGDGKGYGSESYGMDMNRFNGTFEELLTFAGITDPTLDQRLEMLEQRVLVIENEIEEPLKTLDQRLTKVEQRLDAMGTPTVDLYATCTASSLHVRTGPDITYPSVGYLLKGQRVKVLSRQDGWAQIENPAGWSSEKYLNLELSPTQVVQSSPATPQQTPEVPAPEQPAPTPAPEEDSSIYATCKANSLYVRGGPGTSYPPVGGLVKGQRVKVLSRQNGWAQLEKPAGWSSEKYLDLELPNIAPEQFDVEQLAPAFNFTTDALAPTMYALCTANSLYVRQGPDASYPVVGLLVRGQQVKVLQRRNGWVQIDEPAGWSSEHYLEMQQPVSHVQIDPNLGSFAENITPEMYMP